MVKLNEIKTVINALNELTKPENISDRVNIILIEDECKLSIDEIVPYKVQNLKIYNKINKKMMLNVLSTQCKINKTDEYVIITYESNVIVEHYIFTNLKF